MEVSIDSFPVELQNRDIETLVSTCATMPIKIELNRHANLRMLLLFKEGGGGGGGRKELP